MSEGYHEATDRLQTKLESAALVTAFTDMGTSGGLSPWNETLLQIACIQSDGIRMDLRLLAKSSDRGCTDRIPKLQPF